MTGYYLLQFTWGLPQNVLGACLWLILRLRGCRHYRYRCAMVTEWGLWRSMGLGAFIFLGKGDRPDPEHILVHEYGHTLQSLILGPAFVFFIGLPSVLWSNLPALHRYREHRCISYYQFFPERWANRLGEQITGLRAPEQ